MEAIGGLLALLGFLGFIAGLVSLVKPLQFLKIESRKAGAAVAGASFVLFMLGGGFLAATDDTTPTDSTREPTATATSAVAAPATTQAPSTPAAPTTTSTAPSTTTSTAPTIPGTLGLTPSEFRQNWNAFASKVDDPTLAMPEPTVQDGVVQDIFQVTVVDGVIVQGSVNKADGSIRDVAVIGEASSDTSRNIRLILAWGGLISATNPGFGPDQRGEILERLGLLGDADLTSSYDASTVAGGVEYTFQSSPELGVFFFFAADPNDG